MESLGGDSKYSTSPKGEEETALWLWASSEEYSDGGSGELSGYDLARSHGLVLPRSRGFGDKQPLERPRATSSVMVLGRRTCLSRWRIYPTSVAPLLEVARWNSWDFE
ncbi:hypothetical protein Acr_00g0006430 [Actinidia rufa]|uniref:Uncharacterized protein n=1 Tax=Actinidia rufa TaxID=165716 RepID=A0A7J0D9U5_9ERIC|nr:hypothetical protein Acr_00g0006430 [Actinidia rufa]